MIDSVEAQIRAREVERSRALVLEDFAALADLLTEDLVHIHANGQVEDKSAYMASVRTKLCFHSVERPELKVRRYGDLAITTGTLVQSVQPRDSDKIIGMTAVVTQVWRLDGDAWRIASFQATKT